MKYTCEICNYEGQTQQSDEEAYEEFKKNYPDAIGEKLAVVCSLCELKMNKWINSMTKEERKIMREKVKRKYKDLLITQ